MRRKPDGTRIVGRKPDEARIVRRKLDGSPKVERKSGTPDANRRFAAGRAEGHETDPSRMVGHRSSWSAGHRRKSEF
jgi:hypothetical protein